MENDHSRASTLDSQPDPDTSLVNNNTNSTNATKRQSAHISPPYWLNQRSVSQITQTSLDLAPGITLEDNTESQSLSQTTLWAKSITIDDYVIVEGNAPGLGAYVVWNCRVETLDGGPMVIRKRYSEFDQLRERLIKAFPQSTEKSLPPLPAKSVIYKFRPKFLERRRQGLVYFLTCVMLNPEYAGLDAVKEFIFESGQ